MFNREPKYYLDPEMFDLNRLTEEESRKRHKADFSVVCVLKGTKRSGREKKRNEREEERKRRTTKRERVVIVNEVQIRTTSKLKPETKTKNWHLITCSYRNESFQNDSEAN